MRERREGTTHEREVERHAVGGPRLLEVVPERALRVQLARCGQLQPLAQLTMILVPRVRGRALLLTYLDDLLVPLCRQRQRRLSS